MKYFKKLKTVPDDQRKSAEVDYLVKAKEYSVKGAKENQYIIKETIANDDKYAKSTLSPKLNSTQKITENNNLHSYQWIIVPPLKLKWDLVILFVMIYVLFDVPFRICFEVKLAFYHPVQIISDITELIFIVDILVNFSAAFHDNSIKKVVTDKRKIIKMYLKTWFIVDTTTSIPSYIWAYAIGSRFCLVPHFIRATKFVRLLKTTHSLVLLNYWNLSTGNILPVLLGVMKFLGFCCLPAHILACLFVGISDHQNRFDLAFTSQSSMSLYDWSEVSMSDKYILSLFWAVSQLTTVGYGDSLPETRAEFILTILAMVIGVALFGYMIGNVVTMLASPSQLSSEMIEKIQRVRLFMSKRKLPSEMQSRIQSHLEYTWHQKQIYKEANILQDVPSSLRTEILLYINKDIIATVPLLQSMGMDAVTMLSMFFRPVLALPGDIVIHEGFYGKEMYIIQAGKLQELAGFHSFNTSVIPAVPPAGEPQKQFVVELRRLQKGDYFAEYSITLDTACKHPATVKALEFCDLLTVAREDFAVVGRSFPQIYKHIQQQCGQRLDKVLDDIDKSMRLRGFKPIDRKPNFFKSPLEPDFSSQLPTAKTPPPKQKEARISEELAKRQRTNSSSATQFTPNHALASQGLLAAKENLLRGKSFIIGSNNEGSSSVPNLDAYADETKQSSQVQNNNRIRELTLPTSSRLPPPRPLTQKSQPNGIQFECSESSSDDEDFRDRQLSRGQKMQGELKRDQALNSSSSLAKALLSHSGPAPPSKKESFGRHLKLSRLSDSDNKCEDRAQSSGNMDTITSSPQLKASFDLNRLPQNSPLNGSRLAAKYKQFQENVIGERKRSNPSALFPEGSTPPRQELKSAQSASLPSNPSINFEVSSDSSEDDEEDEDGDLQGMSYFANDNRHTLEDENRASILAATEDTGNSELTEQLGTFRGKLMFFTEEEDLIIDIAEWGSTMTNGIPLHGIRRYVIYQKIMRWKDRAKAKVSEKNAHKAIEKMVTPCNDSADKLCSDRAGAPLDLTVPSDKAEEDTKSSHVPAKRDSLEGGGQQSGSVQLDHPVPESEAEQPLCIPTPVLQAIPVLEVGENLQPLPPIGKEPVKLGSPEEIKRKVILPALEPRHTAASETNSFLEAPSIVQAEIGNTTAQKFTRLGQNLKIPSDPMNQENSYVEQTIRIMALQLEAIQQAQKQFEDRQKRIEQSLTQLLESLQK